MAYLIIMRHDNFPVTETGSSIVSATVHPNRPMEYGRIRERMEQLYPDRIIASPLEHLPSAIVHSVYLSPNRDGNERIIGNFQLWAASNVKKERVCKSCQTT
jgi:hypothetical protein